MPLKTVDLKTLQQHVDALHILVNLILTEMSKSAPNSLASIVEKLEHTIKSTPQLHPVLRKLLEDRFRTFATLLASDLQPH